VRFSTSDVASELGGELVGPDVVVDGASIDSRTVGPGQLYVPIVAARDGHRFIRAALDAGAPAYLTVQPPVGATAVVVGDTALALLRLGEVARARLGGGVVGITGSVGKTTTKDLVRHCLASTFLVGASEQSFNNELGLPLTLLNAPDDARWVVLEMGSRGVGHIRRLAEVARPDVGIVTSVAMAHVEFFGDLDGVARAKSELVAALPETGVAVLNFDDPRVARMAGMSPCPVLGYAVDAQAEVRAEAMCLDAELRPRFHLRTPWGDGEVRLALRGVQQVPNALAAAAAALWCGVTLEAVQHALAEVTSSPLRMEVHRSDGGPVLVVDCYNANPASTEAALRSLAALPARRKIAVLGVMAELGDAGPREHKRIAALARDLGIELIAVDAPAYGVPVVHGVEGALAVLQLDDGDAVVVKGSRVAGLEALASALAR